jgi:hypothetical protein
MLLCAAIVVGAATTGGCRPEGPDPYPPPAHCLEREAAFERIQCLEPYVQDLTFETSARYAVCRAEQLQSEGIIDDCHLLAHAIGGVALREFEGDPGPAFASCGPGCLEGCYHGVMESFVGSMPDDRAAIIDALADMCTEMDDDDWYACVHGVGHGLRHHGLLSLTGAVEACENSGDVHWADVCLGGVFMEQVDIHLTLTLDELAVQLPRICEELATTRPLLLEHCVAAIGEGLMFRTGHDLELVHGLCTHLREPDEVDACRHGADVEADVNAHARSSEHCG